jgi:DNA-binding IclR family transcriptional regulator
MADPDERLRDLLGAQPPASVTTLDANTRAALADLLEDSRQRQTSAIEDAFTAALKQIPFPVRGIAKKVLLG